MTKKYLRENGKSSRKHEIENMVWKLDGITIQLIPEATARSEGTNSARLFTPRGTNALARSKVHQ
jgi:hypothetical protein